MSDPGDALQGIWTLLDMFGSLVRKIIRRNRTTLPREWRSRDNGWLGLTTLVMIIICVLLIWAFIVI
jgi:hypothetical protein